jgi:hypothetical protein
MKKLLKLVMCVSILFACSENKEITEAEHTQLVEKLASNKVVLRVKRALENENKLLYEGKIDFTNFDREIVLKEGNNAKTLDKRIALYKKAGMENPRDYLLAKQELSESILELKAKVPEMRQVSANEFSQLIRPSKKNQDQAMNYLKNSILEADKSIQLKIKSNTQSK